MLSGMDCCPIWRYSHLRYAQQKTCFSQILISFAYSVAATPRPTPSKPKTPTTTPAISPGERRGLKGSVWDDVRLGLGVVLVVLDVPIPTVVIVATALHWRTSNCFGSGDLLPKLVGFKGSPWLVTVTGVISPIQ